MRLSRLAPVRSSIAHRQNACPATRCLSKTGAPTNLRSIKLCQTCAIPVPLFQTPSPSMPNAHAKPGRSDAPREAGLKANELSHDKAKGSATVPVAAFGVSPEASSPRLSTTSSTTTPMGLFRSFFSSLHPTSHGKKLGVHGRTIACSSFLKVYASTNSFALCRCSVGRNRRLHLLVTLRCQANCWRGELPRARNSTGAKRQNSFPKPRPTA